MALSNARSTLSGLPRRLVSDGLLNEQDAVKALAEAQQTKRRFVSYAVQELKLPARDVALSAAQEFGLPVFDLSAFDHDSLPRDQIEEDLTTRHHALPLLKRGSRLFVAISDPTNMVALDEYKFHSGLPTEPVLVEDDKLDLLIQQAVNDGGGTELGEGLDDDLDLLDVSSGDEESAPDDSASEIDDTPVVRFVNKVLLDAINRGASDIHVEPYEKKFRIRYRVDGVLQEAAHPPLNMSMRIIARLKVMSRMDISERRVPQDGRIKMKLSKKRAIDFRVNTCPTLFGEKVVLRILDPTSAQLGIEMLGYSDAQKQTYLNALAQPYGMILVTGPTGSGKTVSLYTGLNILNTPERNISTAEDPAEINLPGINQVNVNSKVGLTFAEALKSFLRQDPDVIMVGEIRDLETASIAIKAAQTGHLVLSTLHTNDAPQTLTRLANMGVPAYNIASAVSLIIAQRLGRRLCEHCKAIDNVPREALLEEGFKKGELADLRIYKAVGCSHCHAGYKGRVGVFQVMPVSEEIGRIIMSGGNAIDIADQADRENVANLRSSALDKVRAGLMSLEEADRVTKD